MGLTINSHHGHKMEKSKLQLFAALIALLSVANSPGCSDTVATRENDQPAPFVAVECDFAGASADEIAALVSHPVTEASGRA